MSLPLPLPGETVFGVVARIILRSGAKSANHILKSFGSPNRSRIYSPLGAGSIEDIYRTFPQLVTAVSPTQFVWLHTTAPLLIMFSERYASYEAREKFTKTVVSSGGWAAGPRTCGSLKPDGLRDCPECITQDIQEFGIPYWHREHQIRPVIRCWRHDGLLREHRLPLVGGFPFELPGHGRYSEETNTANLPRMRDLSMEVWLSKALAGLLQHAVDSPTLDHLQASLRRAGIARGIMGNCGPQRQSVWDLMLNAFGAEYLTYLRYPTSYSSHVCSRYTRPLQRKLRQALDPVVAVMLAGVLDLNPSFLWGDDGEGVREKSMTSEDKVPVPDIELENALAASGYILNRTTVSLGISRHQLIRRIERARIECPIIKGANAKFDPGDILGMIDALKRGEPRSIVRDRFGCSDSVIDQLAIYDRNLRGVTRRLRRERARLKNRQAVLQMIVKHPKATRMDLTNCLPGPMSFLVRHDKAWLSAHLPKPVLRIGSVPKAGRGRLDDGELDTSLHKNIREAVIRIQRAVPPRKLTRTLAWRTAGIPMSQFGKLTAGRLPKTAMLLTLECESRERFVERRISYALDRLVVQRSSLSLRSLRAASGLTAATLVAFRELLLRLAAVRNFPLSPSISRKLLCRAESQ